jgi:enterochelin esterase family protein
MSSSPPTAPTGSPGSVIPKLAIQALIDSKPNAEKIDKFLEGRQCPIVEGRSCTFIWRGEAKAVNLRHWIFGLETANALQQVPKTDLWYLTLEIPENSRVEYKFELILDIKGIEGRKWVEDPRNPHRARDPFGANSVLQSDGYQFPDWAKYDSTSRPGLLEGFQFHSKAFGSMRSGKIYLPARFRKTRLYPLLVVHDGTDYINFTSMKNVLDNLIERLEIPDMIVAFTDSPDRLREYANDERHAKFLTEELLVDLTSRLPIIDRPQARCLMGASFGAVASLTTAARYPGVWGRLLLQSGSFAFTDIGKSNRRGPLFDRIVEFMNELRAEPKAISERIFMSCGVYESLIYENRSLIPLLDSTGMQVKFVEARDGHNWENWRDRLREGLSWLFPGPLMFIYE